jgi:hypothetical protein
VHEDVHHEEDESLAPDLPDSNHNISDDMKKLPDLNQNGMFIECLTI